MNGYDVQVIGVDGCLIDIRSDDHGLSALAEVLGMPLPAATGYCTTDGHRHLMQLSPDHWLYSSLDEADEALVPKLNEVFRDDHAVATLITDQYASFRVEGSGVMEVLCQGISMDLSPDRFGPGHGTICAFARTRAVLLPLEPNRCYQVYVESSLGEYVADWLNKAIRGNEAV